MALTLTTSVYTRRIGKGMYLYGVYATGTGDATAGAATANNVVFPKFDLKDEVFFYSAHVQQDDANTQTMIAQLHANEWSMSGKIAQLLVQCANADGWDDLKAITGGYYINNPEKTMQNRYLGKPLKEQPQIDIGFGANTNTKSYYVDLKFIAYRIYEYEAERFIMVPGSGEPAAPGLSVINQGIEPQIFKGL